MAKLIIDRCLIANIIFIAIYRRAIKLPKKMVRISISLFNIKR